jgi:hypothetical protein
VPLSDPTVIVREVRAAASPAVRERARQARRSPAVMRASGMRIEPSSSDALRAISGNRQTWQTHAWGYRDRIGELRYALQFRARAISRVRFFVAEIDPSNDEPLNVALRNDDDQEKAQRITLDPMLCEAAEEELNRLPLDAGYSFIGVWSENADVAGEVWLHGYYDEWGEECWKFRSVDEVDVSADGRTVILKDELLGGVGRRVNLDEEELYRLWVPHPRRAYLADSALCALQDVLEDIVLVGRELRAAARSRVMANGILKAPNGLTVMKNVQEDTDGGPDADDDAFMAELTAALLAPIMNEGDPGSVVPVIVRGEIEDLDAFKHMSLQREDSQMLLEKLASALGRMANGLDIPPEILTGMADVNHWTAWQIDSSTARHHIEPSVRNMADSLTAAFLRPALRKWGFAPSEIKRIRVWYDLGSLTENPNRREDAITAREQGAIGDASFRDALGFGEEDAPSAAESLFMIAMKAGMDQATATAIMRWFADQQDGKALDIPTVPAALPGAAPRAVAAAPPRPGPGQPAGSAPSTQDRSTTPPPAQTAASTANTAVSGTGLSIVQSGPDPDVTYRLATEHARVLMDVDRAVRTQIIAAADAALTRALEKAGARMRAKATADRELSLKLKPINSLAVCEFIGRAEAFKLGATEEHLLAAAFDGLADKFKALVTLGISSIVDRVLKMLGLRRGDDAADKLATRMERSMTGRIDDGWQWLHTALLDRARKRMFGVADDDQPGELSEGDVPAYLVRAALALVGGLPETSGGLDEKGRSLDGAPVGGLANGDTVRREIEQAGGVELGYLWVYGVTPMSRKFDPHYELEGERFASWADPKLDTASTHGGRYAWVGDHFRPGDHTGCMCDYVPGWAIPDYAGQVRERLALPTQGMQDILRLAEGDDAAGRKDTTAQHMRDQYQHIQGLQARFLKGAA